MKTIIVLGSTGSLGKKTIELLEEMKNDYKLIGISAYQSAESFDLQAKKLGFGKDKAVLVKRDGTKKLEALIKQKNVDIVINLISGIGGIAPTILALKEGKKVILANKESIVGKGYLLKKYIKNEQIIPVDSEHNAIFEIIKNHPKEKIKKIIIPCSGGSFYKKSKKELEQITPAQAITHPRWAMGKKISVESATLINKGLEIVEAYYLFEMPLKKIQTFYNPECKIHGAVEFEKSGTFAYSAEPEMKDHIRNALLRAIGKVPTCNIRKIKSLKLKKLNNKNLLGIEIVLKVFKKSPKDMQKFLQKEEKVVNKFLENKIKFTQIFNLLP